MGAKSPQGAAIEAPPAIGLGSAVVARVIRDGAVIPSHRVDAYRERDWPDPARIVGEGGVELALIYRGSLPACQPNDQKLDDKQRIRLDFSQQLEQHWASTGVLRQMLASGNFVKATLDKRKLVMGNGFGSFAQCQVDVFGFQIHPLVCRYNGLVCHLELTLLRRSKPGSIITSAGGADIDNQLKTLFDALRMPLDDKELPGNRFGNGRGQKLFCLLEDDELITRLSVDTQMLHSMKQPNEAENYAEVMLKVNIKVQEP